MDDNFKIQGFVEQRKELEALMMSNPEMEKRVQKLIRTVLSTARTTLSREASSKMKTDPRKAYKAVKSSVYRRILGGSVSLLDRKGKAGGSSSYEPPRTLNRDRRGGNRVPRSQRTQQVMSYEGRDRAFILRFLNQGTNDREAGTRGGRLHGSRGRIAPRNFFATSSARALEQAAQQLTTLIDDLIKKEFK